MLKDIPAFKLPDFELFLRDLRQLISGLEMENMIFNEQQVK